MWAEKTYSLEVVLLALKKTLGGLPRDLLERLGD